MDDFGLSFPAQINIRPLLTLRKGVQEDQERTQGSKRPTQSISRGPKNYQDAPRGPHKTGFEHAAGRRKQSAPYPRNVTSIADAQSSHHTYEPAEPRDYDWRRDFQLPNTARSELSPSPRPPSPPPSNSRYETLKTLNTRPHAGSKTYLIQDRQTKILFIEKRLQTSTTASRAHAETQESALWQLKSITTNTTNSSTHILQIRESFQTHPHPHPCTTLILEFFTHSSLSDLIARSSNPIPEPFAGHVLSSLTSALCTCHYGIPSPETNLQRPKGDWNALYHFNLTPKSVFLTSTYQQGPFPRVVLGGFTCVATKEKIESDVAERAILENGDGDWFPPEVLQSPPILSKFADIWQLGSTIQTLCRHLPTPEQFLADEGRPCGSKYSSELNNIITCCMHRDWRNRPTAIELMREILESRPEE